MNMREQILRIVTSCGVTNAVAIGREDIVFDASFRKLCETNRCGRYGRYYVCPPFVGDIHVLIEEARSYPYAILYQTISALEDSFDIEGMREAGKRNHLCAGEISGRLAEAGIANCLHLSSGGCILCERCGVEDHIPCRHPDKALSNMESYGINVSATAGNAGLKYINGPNTVTYFGIVFFGEKQNA